MSSVKRIVEKLCADGRLEGVVIMRVQLMPSVFEQLAEETGQSLWTTEFQIMTCNGPTKVERL